jgi:hypothetical protein
VFALSGQKITLKMAAAACGYLDPEPNATVTLVRKMDGGPDKVVTVHLKDVFEGREADRYLQDGDVLTIRINR